MNQGCANFTQIFDLNEKSSVLTFRRKSGYFVELDGEISIKVVKIR